MTDHLSAVHLATLFPTFTGVLPALRGSQYLRTYLDPFLVVVLAGGLALYLWGVARNNRLHPRHPWPKSRIVLFLLGWAVTVVALLSFIGAYDSTLFWVHMVQHLMLIMVAAGLFAASSPVALAWRATTGDAHRRLTAALRSRAGTVVGHPATAFVLYGVLVPLTHLTVFFNWAIEYRAFDDLEHVLFIGIGYLFWRQIFGDDPNRFRTHPAGRALLLFLAVPVDTFVGLSLDSESREIFPAFTAMHRTWGPSLVMDLHVGGVIMWVGGDSLMMVALIPVVIQWVRIEERRATRVDREFDAYFPPVEHAGGQPTAGYALGTYVPRGSRRGQDRAVAPAPASIRGTGGAPPAAPGPRTGRGGT
jgi:cytochrome c oxidase assembly factor CtaG